jgi:hypothetical protein
MTLPEKRLLVFLLCILALVMHVSSQQITANPFITNHPKNVLQGGRENWDLHSLDNGVLLAANNEGVLVYNGRNWKLHRLPNRTIVRSVEADPQNERIFAGGQDEFGYFCPDENGNLHYYSLMYLLPKEHTSLEDVWDISISGQNVYFRSKNKLFVYDGKKIACINAEDFPVHFLTVMDEKMVVSNPEKGIFEWTGSTMMPLTGGDIFRNKKINAVIPLTSSEWLVFTEKNGIYHYDTKTAKKLEAFSPYDGAIITSAVKINKRIIALATALKGILFIDNTGNVLFDITTKNGLLSNSFICLETDNRGNLWAGSSKGIDHILINGAFSLFYPDADLAGGVYAVKYHKGFLYAGTNNGLYVSNWKKNPDGIVRANFKEVENTSGQVWGLDIVENDLFMGHNEGAFQIQDDKAEKISSSATGFWKFIPLKEDKMLAGSYSGCYVLSKTADTWRELHKIEGFDESARIMTTDFIGSLWVSHPYRGVFRLSLSDDLKSLRTIKVYGKNEGLPSGMGNYVTKLNGNIYVTGERNVFAYDAAGNTFRQDDTLTAFLGMNTHTRRLFQEQGTDIWFDNEQAFGMIRIDETPLSKSSRKINIDFIKGRLIGGFENVYTPDSENAFICTEQGLIGLDLQKFSQKRIVYPRFNEIYYQNPGKTILYGGFGPLPDKSVSLPAQVRNISVSVGSDETDDTQSLQYSFKLQGYSNDWSAWNASGDTTFYNLPFGTYSVQVRVRNIHGEGTRMLNYPFTVVRPWYVTYPAMIAYGLAGFMLFRLSLKRAEKKHRKEKQILISEKEASDVRVEQLLREKLQAEVDYKTKELGLSTMHIVQKSETLKKIKEDLDQLMNQATDTEVRKRIKKTINLLANDQTLEQDWESFARHFDQVHTDFIKRLKERYPQLSPNDLKLCAYLRMNLSSKEIAPLLNISVRGIEISRYRLRKKMQLPAETVLSEFMLNF